MLFQHGFGSYVAEDVRNQEWEYRGNEVVQGTMEHRFEVLCKDRTGRGIHRDRVVQENLIRADGNAFCSCMKPKLLHLPCSLLIATCAESGL